MARQPRFELQAKLKAETESGKLSAQANDERPRTNNRSCDDGFTHAFCLHLRSRFSRRSRAAR